MKPKKIRYYQSYTDDFEQTKNQNYQLPDNYKWIKNDPLSRFLSGFIYTLAILFSSCYCKLFLHVRFKGRENLKGIKGGYFIYGNHTQPVGDVFIPALAVLPKRIYTVVSTANYGIPVIGKILPYLGALPIVNSLYGIKELNKAIKQRIDNGHPIVIYPEAHVWEYCTEIRPFPETSFKFPIKFNKPAFAMTVTYQKSKFFKRPIATVFLDGPFYPEGCNPSDRAANLKTKVFNTMKQRSQESNYSYIEYQKK